MTDTNRSDWPYWTALAGYLGLFVLLMGWIIWWSPPQALPRSIVLLLLVGPLLLPLRGLLHRRHGALVASAGLALLYMLHGTIEAYSTPGDRWLAFAEIALSAVLYAGAFMTARRMRKELSQGSA